MAAKIDSSNEAIDTEPIDWESETHVGSTTPIVKSAVSQKPDGLQVALTGSTGFLGLAILKALLADKRVAKVHCLAIRSLAQKDPIFASSRVACYQGDLALPYLGLPQEQFVALAQSFDRIIHNGADVSFLKRFQSLQRPNVEATRKLVDIAMDRCIPFHFVSTGGVVNLTGLDGLPEVSVSNYEPPVDGSYGYIASKWASERILESCAEKGLPVWIHRPSNITGQNAPSHDLMQNIFRYSGETSSLPDISGWKVTLTLFLLRTWRRALSILSPRLESPR
ncbi:hypothetical protein NXS19_013050 [Fusarium pseudograminearum]|nr:hypothetical protein NXS19_013050 [Fusarium pseudograminearum]